MHDRLQSGKPVETLGRKTRGYGVVLAPLCQSVEQYTPDGAMLVRLPDPLRPIHAKKGRYVYMKKMEKLVPAAVAGLVLAAGTLDARAEEAALPVLPVDDNTPVQEEKQQSDMLDTTIKDVEPAPQPDAGEESGNPGGEEDGGQE